MSGSPKHSRRRFIQGAGLAGMATTMMVGPTVQSASGQSSTVPPSSVPPSTARPSTARPSVAKAHNLIFLVVDGMCHGTLGLAHHWNLRNRNEPLHWMGLYDRPGLHRCFQDTSSASSPVTDSAAAASAWGSGHRVNNGSINIDAKGRLLTPFFTRAKEAGKRTGLVSTCRISHATPAGFVANVPNRDQEEDIIGQYLDRKVDVLLGGGSGKFLDRSKEGVELDYFKKFASAGYRLSRDREQLSQVPANGQALLGIFSESHIPYAIDRAHDKALAGVPGLEEMFRAALLQLKDSRDGFVLQVEAGRVDHAGHANDPGAILHDMLEFDRCIPIALQFIEKHPDTLLIVTTDHGTGGCQLDGKGKAYSESGPALDTINQFRHSFEWLEYHFRAAGRFDAKLFEQATGFSAKPEQIELMESALRDPNLTYLNSRMTAIFDAELKDIAATGWSSNAHTSENVELLAFGPGSEQVSGFVRNAEVFGWMTSALRI